MDRAHTPVTAITHSAISGKPVYVETENERRRKFRRIVDAALSPACDNVWDHARSQNRNSMAGIVARLLENYLSGRVDNRDPNSALLAGYANTINIWVGSMVNPVDEPVLYEPIQQLFLFCAIPIAAYFHRNTRNQGQHRL
ncbi:hypothetical protein GGH95_002276, partial [Coemansia sp. RSA 1836]